MTGEVQFAGDSGAEWRCWPNRPLGKPGGFGRVFAAESADGNQMAVKVVTKDRTAGLLTGNFAREVDIAR